MTELVQWCVEAWKDLPKEWVVFIISMIPILELRGGLVAAALLNVNILTAVPICILGNVLPVPFILWFITPLFARMKKTKLFRPMVEKLEAKANSKKESIEKGYFWGLALFVGIPLPGTGAWTGSLIAAMMEIPFKKSFPAVILGILIAAVIMSAFSYGLLDSLIALFA